MDHKNPQLDKEETLAYLAHTHEAWSPLYRRVLRSAGLDATVNGEFRLVDARMNHLLEDLFDQNVALATGYSEASTILPGNSGTSVS